MKKLKSMWKKIREQFTPEYIVYLLKQPTTIRAFIVLVAYAGYKIEPAELDLIVQALIVVLCGHEVLRDENKKPQ